MNRIYSILLIGFVLTGCRNKISASDIANINGYWEIQKVIFANGSQKDFKMNDTFDYFEIKNNKGFRKKVMPQFDGTFLVNDASEDVTIKQVGGKYFLNYSTSFAKWKEELLAISNSELVTLNEASNEYHYKRAAPINLTGDGKKTQ